MSYSIDSIEAAVAEARAKGKERNIKFEQSFDVAVNFRKRELDVSKPENRLNQELILPNTLYPPPKICAFGDGEFAEKAIAAGAERVVSKDDIPRIGDEKKERKALAKSYDFFIAAVDAMPLIGRYLGQVLGSRGKMPKPFPPQADLNAVINQYHRTVRVRMRNTPTFHVKVGHERMTDREIADNVVAVLNMVQNKGFAERISSVMIKTTMGPMVRVSV
ncbi:MAG: 50S ribosomal protein L1 [Candidatus Thorarchaeota archaeon]|nr:MAG: 50S ribosomal protein L1 [Candidatus Thorarchaeota archaeon]RLI58921.1 MAG: 50S ribosomal protein L1 [Candidatus Thorarchaeota archaeon]